jgi:hypothetical protein
MRLLFVYWRPEDAGSAQTIGKYSQAAKELGHEVALYAPPDEAAAFDCSLDIGAVDAVIFILEWNLYLLPGGKKKDRRRMRDGLMGVGHLNVVRLLSRIPRARRIIIDNDGMYNELIRVDGDSTHPSPEARRARVELCEALTDKIYQPTRHPVPAGVGTFLFHAYDASSEVPLDPRAKPFGMMYVGSNWFRWRAMERVLRALEPIRDRVGRIGLVGHDWDAVPWWVDSPLREDAYYTEPAYLAKLGVEVMPAIPVADVISRMSQGLFNPVLLRPTFAHLRLFNPRQFETPAANTVPLLALPTATVVELYGDAGRELVLGDHPAERIFDVLQRPDYYIDVVKTVRRHLAEHHSYAVRLRELLKILGE